MDIDMPSIILLFSLVMIVAATWLTIINSDSKIYRIVCTLLMWGLPVCLLIKSGMNEYVNETGNLHEAFYLIFIGYLLFFAGFIGYVIFYIMSKIK